MDFLIRMDPRRIIGGKKLGKTRARENAIEKEQFETFLWKCFGIVGK